jgi:hypothetical protein
LTARNQGFSRRSDRKIDHATSWKTNDETSLLGERALGAGQASQGGGGSTRHPGNDLSPIHEIPFE